MDINDILQTVNAGCVKSHTVLADDNRRISKMGE